MSRLEVRARILLALERAQRPLGPNELRMWNSLSCRTKPEIEAALVELVARGSVRRREVETKWKNERPEVYELAGETADCDCDAWRTVERDAANQIRRITRERAARCHGEK